MAIDFPANPTNGQVYGNYIYDSSITAWRNVNTDTGIGTLNAMGLKNITPSSVAVGSGSATITANGFVTFTDVSSISFNDIFSANYNNYQFNLLQTSATVQDTTILGRLRVSGSDASTSYYEGGTYHYSGTINSINNLNINQWDIGRTHSAANPLAHSGASFKLLQPFFARPTTFFTESSSWNGASTTGYRFGGFHTTLTAYTGFSLILGSGTFSGTIQIYGYNN